MYINKLYLRAFGKFTYKRIYLGKKLNIIYGENETGKSTIHNFVEAVLYGFDDEPNGNALYKKFKPWDSNLYKGSITIDGIDNNKYLIAKDFLLGTTRVFNKDLEDSENSSAEAENIECPGEHFFNINKTSYRNTVSIKQLGNKTDKELAIEVKNKIINLSNSKDESISIERILETINNIKVEAGSEDNPKTLLGQYALRLKELHDTKETILNRNRQVMFLSMEKKKLFSKVQEIEMHISDLNKELISYELSIERSRYDKALPIKVELDEVIEKLSLYIVEDSIKKYSDNDFEEASKLSSALNIMRNERHNLINRKEELEETLRNLKEDVSNNIKDTFDILKMNNDFNAYEINRIKIDEMRCKITVGTDSLKSFDVDEINNFMDYYKSIEENNSKIVIIETLLGDKNYDLMKKFIKSKNIKSFLINLLGTIFIALAGLSGYVAYYYNVPEYYGGVVIAILGIVSFFISAKYRRRVVNAKREIDSIECKHAEYNKNVQELSNEIDEVLKKIECADLNELKSTYEKKESQQNVIKEKLKLLDFDKESLNSIEEIYNSLEKSLVNDLNLFCITEITGDSINKANGIYNRKNYVQDEIIKCRGLINETDQSLSKVNKEISFEEKRLNVILNSNKMNSIDEFKQIVEKYQKISELKSKKEHLENMLSTVLGKANIDELRIKTENVFAYDVIELDKKEQQIIILKLNEEKNKIQMSINNIDKEIDEIESSIRNLAEVEEEIEFYEDKKSIFRERIQVAEIAASKIVEISDSIKGDFMPLLRKSISENFAYVTNGKYKEVLIDEDMNISLASEDNKDRNIHIDSLSGGTLDQLYLSLRISLSNILSGNQNIPIILDDSFVQYDSNRLKKSIEMLAKESERRQVILFTCQEREVEIAKNLNFEFNLIKL